ncbi:MAG: S41 family peptidase [Gemmatimonadota bacterium]
MSGVRWKGPRRAAAVLAAAAAGLAPVPAAAQAPAADALTAAVAAATFDTAWATIGRAHYDTTYNGVDWNAVRAELGPRAAAARDNAQLRAVLGEMLGRLRQSHLAVIPGEAYAAVEAATAGGGDAGASGPPGSVGVEVRLVGGQVVVTRVDAGGPADRAGVRPGWAVDSVGRHSSAELLAALARLPEPAARTRAYQGALAVHGWMRGAAGEPVRVRFRDGRDRPVAVELARAALRGEEVVMAGLPPMHVWLESRRVPAGGGAVAGVIRFNVWAPSLVGEFDRAVDELRGTDGIVIDLRGNPGGSAFMPAGVTGHFFPEPRLLGVMKVREGEWRVSANPRRVTADGRTVEPFAGPVAILVDALSASASEFTAGGMQGVGRARVFGETSAGAVLPSATRRLPNGDVLQYVTGDFALPTGKRFEGSGVVPDVAAPPTRAELLAGRDPALDSALRWIAEQDKRGASR